MFRTFSALLAGAIFTLSLAAAAAPVYTDLHSFGATGDGSLPYSVLAIDANGVLYGVTFYGGRLGGGTAYSLLPPSSPGGAWTETVLWDFGGARDGVSPNCLVVGSGGVLYGTAGGGPNSDGVVFSLTPPASPGGQWAEAILHSFGATSSDGTRPVGVVIGAGGVLYGATAQGGGSNADGTVFSLTPPSSPGGAWTEDFVAVSAAGDPVAPLALGPGGVLYGAALGGLTGRHGTIFSVTPPASPGGQWTQSVVHYFGKRPDGGEPNYASPVAVDSKGVVYGTTLQGGSAGGGVVYSLAPPASPGSPWTETILHQFTKVNGVPSRGWHPSGVTVDPATGALYGVTGLGGSSATSTKHGDGVIFKLSPPTTGTAWKFTVLHSFRQAGGTHPAVAPTVGADGVLYGTAAGGGPNAAPNTGGVAFSLVP